MNDENPIEEKKAPHTAGMPALISNILLMVVSIGLIIMGIFLIESRLYVSGILLVVAFCLYLCVIGPIAFAGLKILKPNEAYVLTLFGKYLGTLRGPGFFFVNPFVSAVCPVHTKPATAAVSGEGNSSVSVTGIPVQSASLSIPGKKISLKALTLSNDKQKVNVALGNPIVISIVVVWKVVNTAKAVFNVDNYVEYLSIQCDSALRNIVRLYPYDAPEDEGEKSLWGSSQEIAECLKTEIQQKAEIAGLEILEARITHLSYAPEIAAAMLQRQQASAIVAARQLIVEGAVGMVEMALAKLNEKNIIDLDEERKAAMVSNLLVVLCGNKDAQPVVNSGTLY
jgi:regulator of protease activity HflC (stomatin/prohibitin superfamily)